MTAGGIIDELDALHNVFASHETGSAKVYLTQQVVDEFSRNRENKIKDALKKFQESKFSAQLPSFMRAYPEHDEILQLSTSIQNKQKDILAKVNKDISERNLLADKLIGEIFKKSNKLETTQDIYSEAKMRVALGNPPGKHGSIGDAINWINLLRTVPPKENLFVISEDGDYFSLLFSDKPHPFLETEWQEKKESKITVFRSLSAFMKQHFDGISLSFDKKKDELIDALFHSGSYAQSHALVSQLEEYGYFSFHEVNRILEAAIFNDQFGPLRLDYDISDFLNRVAVPHMKNISNHHHLGLLEDVIEEKKERQLE